MISLCCHCALPVLHVDLLAVSASKALERADEEQGRRRLKTLARCAERLRQRLSAIDGLVCSSSAGSPVLVLVLSLWTANPAEEAAAAAAALLRRIAAHALRRGGVATNLVTRDCTVPSLRLLARQTLSDADIDRAAEALEAAVYSVRRELDALVAKAAAAAAERQRERRKSARIERRMLLLGEEAANAPGDAAASSSSSSSLSDAAASQRLDAAMNRGPLLLLFLPAVFRFAMTDMPPAVQIMMMLWVALGYAARDGTTLDSRALSGKAAKHGGFKALFADVSGGRMLCLLVLGLVLSSAFADPGSCSVRKVPPVMTTKGPVVGSCSVPG